MKVLFAVGVLNGRFYGGFGRGLRLSDKLFFTNEPGRVALLSQNFESLIGVLEAQSLRSAPGVVYSVTDHDPNVFGDEDAQKFVTQQLHLALFFLRGLWLIRDNAVNIEQGFVEHPHRGGLGSAVSSNSIRVSYTDASGGSSVQDFSEEEMRGARDMFRPPSWRTSDSRSPAAIVRSQATPVDSREYHTSLNSPGPPRTWVAKWLGT